MKKLLVKTIARCTITPIRLCCFLVLGIIAEIVWIPTVMVFNGMWAIGFQRHLPEELEGRQFKILGFFSALLCGFWVYFWIVEETEEKESLKMFYKMFKKYILLIDEKEPENEKTVKKQR